MKKLVIIAAVALAAFASNAAAVKWNSSALVGTDGEKAGSDYSIIATIVSDSTGTFAAGTTSDATYNKGLSATKTFGDTGAKLGTIVISATAYGPGGVSLDLGTQTLELVDAGSTYTAKFVANNTKEDWGAVPEPTSGMLLLLGVAGLALRRRRA